MASMENRSLLHKPGNVYCVIMGVGSLGMVCLTLFRPHYSHSCLVNSGIVSLNGTVVVFDTVASGPM